MRCGIDLNGPRGKTVGYGTERIQSADKFEAITLITFLFLKLQHVVCTIFGLWFEVRFRILILLKTKTRNSVINK